MRRPSRIRPPAHLQGGRRPGRTAGHRLRCPQRGRRPESPRGPGGHHHARRPGHQEGQAARRALLRHDLFRTRTGPHRGSQRHHGAARQRRARRPSGGHPGAGPRGAGHLHHPQPRRLPVRAGPGPRDRPGLQPAPDHPRAAPERGRPGPRPAPGGDQRSRALQPLCRPRHHRHQDRALAHAHPSPPACRGRASHLQHRGRDQLHPLRMRPAPAFLRPRQAQGRAHHRQPRRPGREVRHPGRPGTHPGRP